MSARLVGTPVIAGAAEGSALVSREPLSFWGGLDPRTGEIIDRRHERSGEVVSGRVFVFPAGRGSSTSSGILLESIRLGTAPAAIINCRTDPILALGSIVADEMYGTPVPIVVLDDADLRTLRDGDRITVHDDGTLIVEPRK